VVRQVRLEVLQAVLYPVDAVHEAKPGVDDALDDGHELLVGTLLALVVEGGDGDEDGAEHLLLENEVHHGDAELHVSEELDLVEQLLQALHLVLVEDVSVLGPVCQVQLKPPTSIELSLELVVEELALDQGEAAVPHTHDREVVTLLLVVLLGPLQDLLHGLDVVEVVSVVVNEQFGVARNVDPVQLGQGVPHLLTLHAEVQGHSPRPRALQKLDVTVFDKHLLGEDLDVVSILVGQTLRLVINSLFGPLELGLPLTAHRHRLHKYSYYGSVGLCSGVVSSSHHRRLAHLGVLALRVLGILLAI